MKLRNNKAFTLTEAIIGMLIFSFMIAGLYSTLLAGNVSWESFNVNANSQREVRKALDLMSRDFRIADNVSLTQTSSDVNLSFDQSGIGNVIYTWTTTGSSANQILRQAGSTTRIIARDISTFSVTDASDNISVSVQATTTSPKGHVDVFQLSNKVAKR